jgi:tetratricopeptide (TPR) repeat protein
LIPVTSSYGSSAKPVADLSIIQQYLEEFIICCKACFKAYEKRSSAYTLFNCASANSYISNNFYQAYMELQSQWEVECRGVSQNYRDCVMEILESYFILVKEEVIAPPNVATSSEVRSSGSEDCIPLYDEGLEYFTQGDLDSAIAYFTNAIKCNNNYAPAYFFRARSYWRKEKIDCAIEDMIRALNIAEQDSSAFTMLEDLHLADVYFDLGLLYGEINELKKAARHFQKARPLLERLSVSSSKRKTDYQKLEMLIMCNYARIQNENNQKKYADFLVPKDQNLSSQDPLVQKFHESFSQESKYRSKKNDTFIDNQPQSILNSSVDKSTEVGTFEKRAEVGGVVGAILGFCLVFLYGLSVGLDDGDFGFGLFLGIIFGIFGAPFGWFVGWVIGGIVGSFKDNE